MFLTLVFLQIIHFVSHEVLFQRTNTMGFSYKVVFDIKHIIVALSEILKFIKTVKLLCYCVYVDFFSHNILLHGNSPCDMIGWDSEKSTVKLNSEFNFLIFYH